MAYAHMHLLYKILLSALINTHDYKDRKVYSVEITKLDENHAKLNYKKIRREKDA